MAKGFVEVFRREKANANQVEERVCEVDHHMQRPLHIIYSGSDPAFIGKYTKVILVRFAGLHQKEFLLIYLLGSLKDHTVS